MAKAPKDSHPKYVLTDLCKSWRRRIEASLQSDYRKGFMATASMCHSFYAGAFGLMWDDKFRNEHLGGIPSPRFKITLNKAFEMVAIYGPTIMWDYPQRVIKNLEKTELPPEAFGVAATPDPEASTHAIERYKLYLEDRKHELGMDKIRNGLMSDYLNWSHREQIGGGMILESHLGIIEAIVKGRGCLFTDTYEHPAADGREFTRGTFVSVDDIFLDPECRRNNLSDCYWIAIRRRTPYWELERRFKLPANSLRDKATHESVSSASVNQSSTQQAKRMQGDSNDIVEWYEIFSKEGVGNRNRKHMPELDKAFEEVVGDYAYLAICGNVDYPLNFPPKLAAKADDDAARAAFEWPIPYYKDGRWPVAFLDFYAQPNSPWPLAPMAMGLGELVLMNVLVSCLADRAFESSRTLGLVSDSLGTDVVERIKNFDYSGFEVVPGNMASQIKDLITFIEMPGVGNDIWKMVEYAGEMFDKRTGLISRVYGEPTGQPRSATESESQQSATNTRPEWMSRKAEDWLTEQANQERIAAGWRVEGSSLVPLFGRDGAQLWDELIASADPSVYLLEMRATLETNSIKKPNKFRDNANIQQATAYIMPILDRYFQQTNDPKPLNSFITAMGDAMDQDTSSWVLPEMPVAPPSPEDQARQQADQERMQVDNQSAKENLRGKQLRNAKLETETTPVAMPEDMMAQEQAAQQIPPPIPLDSQDPYAGQIPSNAMPSFQ